MAKAKSDSRTLVIRALVNKNEKKLITTKAKHAGLSVSNFLRIGALHTNISEAIGTPMNKSVRR